MKQQTPAQLSKKVHKIIAQIDNLLIDLICAQNNLTIAEEKALTKKKK